MNHRNMNPCLTRLRQLLVIFAQSPASSQPSQSTFNHPTTRQHLKTMTVFRTPHNLQNPATNCTCPIHQGSSIGRICPDQLKPGESPQELSQHKLGSITVLNVSSMDHNSQQQTYGVDYDVSLASFNLLTRIVAAWPPFSVVLTDWLSMMPALGVSSRPSFCLTLVRKASSILCHVPSLRHSLKYHHTVPQGGRS